MIISKYLRLLYIAQNHVIFANLFISSKAIQEQIQNKHICRFHLGIHFGL